MKLSYIYEGWCDRHQEEIQRVLCEHNWEDNCSYRLHTCGDGWNEPRITYCDREDDCPFLEKELEVEFQDWINDDGLQDYEDVENDMEDVFELPIDKEIAKSNKEIFCATLEK